MAEHIVQPLVAEALPERVIGDIALGLGRMVVRALHGTEGATVAAEVLRVRLADGEEPATQAEAPVLGPHDRFAEVEDVVKGMAAGAPGRLHFLLGGLHRQCGGGPYRLFAVAHQDDDAGRVGEIAFEVVLLVLQAAVVEIRPLGKDPNAQLSDGLQMGPSRLAVQNVGAEFRPLHTRQRRSDRQAGP